ncbi:MAG: hypothetical protein ACK413_03570, partial [Patescibacteria group bacterium]
MENEKVEEIQSGTVERLSRILRRVGGILQRLDKILSRLFCPEAEEPKSGKMENEKVERKAQPVHGIEIDLKVFEVV